MRLGLAQFAVLRRRRPCPRARPFGLRGPKSAEIAKIAPAPERSVLGRPDELEGARWRSREPRTSFRVSRASRSPDTRNARFATDISRRMWLLRRLEGLRRRRVRRRVWHPANGHADGRKLAFGRPYTSLRLGLAQFAVLRRQRPAPRATPFGPQSPKSAEIAKMTPAPERSVLGRPDALEGARWRSREPWTSFRVSRGSRTRDTRNARVATDILRWI